MTDLVAGRYSVSEEEWLRDGSPVPPYRRTVNRNLIATGSTGLALTQAQLFVYAIPVQQGDIFNFVSILVKTATATPTHSWAAVYNGTGASATLLAQTPDVVGGFPAGASKLQLTAAVSAVGQPGTPQGPAGGPGSWALTAAAPAVWGVALYNSGATGAVLDGMPGGQVAGEIAVTGQLPLVSQVALAATATAPANLAGIAAVVGTGIPYVLLSKQ